MKVWSRKPDNFQVWLEEEIAKAKEYNNAGYPKIGLKEPIDSEFNLCKTRDIYKEFLDRVKTA